MGQRVINVRSEFAQEAKSIQDNFTDLYAVSSKQDNDIAYLKATVVKLEKHIEKISRFLQ